MLKFSALHYETNWFMALFSTMKKVVLDAKTKQPLISFKQTWGNSFLVYGDSQFGNLIVEARFLLKRAAFEWDIYEPGKSESFAHMKAHIFKTILTMGGEVLSITKPDGGVFLTLEREESSALKHVVDGLLDLYNPTHVYTLKNADGVKLGTIAAKHGIFKQIYDFAMEGGTEKERAAGLAVFAYILLSMKK